MRAQEHLPSSGQRYWKVSVWKDDVDPSSPQWLKLFFKYVYLTFLDFCFWLGVPKTKEVIVESDEYGNVRRTYIWYEDVGSFDYEDQAIAACLTDRYGYKGMRHGQLAPFESAQFQGTIFPRKKNPRKWAKPTMSLVIKDRKEDECKDKALAECLNQINQVLDIR